MPTTQEHIKKQGNLQITLSYLQQSQNSPQHADSIVTLAFYKALHAVDSYLATLHIHPKVHTNKYKTGRNQYVQQHLSSIHQNYSTLYDASKRARYEAYTFQNYPKDVNKLIDHSSNIEQHIRKLLQTP